MYGNDEVNAGDSVQMATLSSEGAATATVSEAATAGNGKASNGKKALKKKMSKGFDNPLFFNAKV